MSRRMPEVRSRPQAGFTIVELLVVVAIIGVLLGMLLPAVQAAEVAAAPIPLFDCPSTREANPMTDRLLEAIVPIHVFGTTDYALCKGATDGWCVRTAGGGIVAAGSMPAALRGAFDIHFGASFHEITDGISSTFAMGEASGDPRWHVCHLRDCREPEADATGGSSTSNFRSNHPDVCGFL